MNKDEILMLAVAGLAYSDGEVLDNLRAVLEQSDLDINVEVVSAEIVLDKARLVNPSQILIGHRPLPSGSSKRMGGTVIQALKADPETQHIPILLIEGLQDIENVARKFGADSFLQVPTSPDEFVCKVRSLINARSA